MIIDAILLVLLTAVGFVVDLLPDATPLGLSGSFTGILYGYAWLNSLAPVAEVLTAGGIYLGAVVLTIGVRAVLMAYKLIPGKLT